MPATICSSVLLPEPFSPTMQKVSPRLISKADVVQRPEILVELKAAWSEQLFQPVAGRIVDGVALRNALKFDVRHASVAQSPVYLSN